MSFSPLLCAAVFLFACRSFSAQSIQANKHMAIGEQIQPHTYTYECSKRSVDRRDTNSLLMILFTIALHVMHTLLKPYHMYADALVVFRIARYLLYIFYRCVVLFAHPATQTLFKFTIILSARHHFYLLCANSAAFFVVLLRVNFGSDAVHTHLYEADRYTAVRFMHPSKVHFLQCI